MSFLKKFNQTFDEFIEDLIRVFPSDPEYRVYQLALKTASIFDESLTQKIFHDKVVVPYGEQILAKNEGFFLSHDYSDLKDEHKDAEQLIDKIKNSWLNMTTEDREIVWKYFRVLILLDRKISI